MKKVLVIALLLATILFVNLISAEIAFSDSKDPDDIRDNGILCLNGKINESCDSLSLKEQIFSLLAVGECKDEIENASKNDECWPKASCDIKTTAQAIMVLDRRGVNTTKAEEWLMNQNKTPTNLDWYLQIESEDATTCSISYNGQDYDIAIGEDKKINQDAGNCLTLSEGDWWLQINSNCYDNTFEIKCDQSFLTTLLFKEGESSTIHVIENTNSASADGTTEERINALCFTKGSSCDYEGSLWATWALYDLGYDISMFIPYLSVGQEDTNNQKYLPESFIYLLTGDDELRKELLGKQSDSGYWSASGDKYYDTAVALYPFPTDFTEKDKTIKWLTETQIDSGDNQGCWNNGNIVDTAFLLYSVWGVEEGYVPNRDEGDDNIPADNDCETNEGYCMLQIECFDSGGEVLDNYWCDGSNKCCDTEKSSTGGEDCWDKGGETCFSYETCSGEEVSADDLDPGQTCCINGECESGGTTEDGCDDDGDCNYGEICDSSGECVEENTGGPDDECYPACNEDEKCKDGICVEKTNYLWVWILLGLIVLVLIGILFKDKLIELFDKFGIGKGKKPKRPGFGPPSGMMPPRPRPTMRPRSLPPRRPINQNRKPLIQNKGGDESDEVLKKLKEMGK